MSLFLSNHKYAHTGIQTRTTVTHTISESLVSFHSFSLPLMSKRSEESSVKLSADPNAEREEGREEREGEGEEEERRRGSASPST